MRFKINSKIINITNRTKSLNYTDFLSRKIIKFIGQSLNLNLNRKLKDKQWFIILYPWVSRFVENSYIIFNSKSSFKNQKKTNLKNFIPLDMIQFYKIIESESWNIYLMNEVKKFRKNGTLTNLNFKEIEKNQFFSIKSFLKKFLDKFFNIFRLRSNLLISNIGLTLIDTIKVGWYLKNFPLIKFDYFHKNKKFVLNKKFRCKDYKKFISNNNFEIFLVRNLMKYIPLNYLENFNQINEKVKTKYKSVKFFITAYDHITDDYIKIYHAQKFKKIKFCVIRHGTSFLNINYNLKNFEKEISYKYLVQKPISSKESFLPHYFSLTKNKSTSKKTKICFIYYEPKKFDHFRDGPIYEDNLSFILSTNKIIKFLHKKFKKDLVIVSNRNSSYPNTNKLKVKFSENLIDKPLIFNKYLDNSKLFIASMPYSTFIQAFLTGPTILFLNKHKWIHSKKFNLIKKEMIKNKMIFEDEKKMIEHVLKISENPNNWWSSKNVTKTREKFKKLFGINHSSLKEFSFFLKTLK